MSSTPERWLELSVRSASAAERADLLADALVALGGRATEERDGWYLTHIAAPDDVDAFSRNARDFIAGFTGLKDLAVHTRLQEHEDWAEAWKRGLAPRRITSRLVVTPSWMDPRAQPGELVIVVDPGMAFGTAEHGTTRGCLRLLDGTVKAGEEILDVGAGSGILSVAAALLGAQRVVAVEGDPLATEALEKNVAANGVAHHVEVLVEWADNDGLLSRGPVDGIVANIESGILTPLLPGLAGALKPGAWLILSGILDTQWDHLAAAATNHGLALDEVDADGEWRSGRFTRRA